MRHDEITLPSGETVIVETELDGLAALTGIRVADLLELYLRPPAGVRSGTTRSISIADVECRVWHRYVVTPDGFARLQISVKLV